MDSEKEVSELGQQRSYQDHNAYLIFASKLIPPEPSPPFLMSTPISRVASRGSDRNWSVSQPVWASPAAPCRQQQQQQQQQPSHTSASNLVIKRCMLVHL